MKFFMHLHFTAVRRKAFKSFNLIALLSLLVSVQAKRRGSYHRRSRAHSAHSRRCSDSNPRDQDSQYDSDFLRAQAHTPQPLPQDPLAPVEETLPPLPSSQFLLDRLKPINLPEDLREDITGDMLTTCTELTDWASTLEAYPNIERVNARCQILWGFDSKERDFYYKDLGASSYNETLIIVRKSHLRDTSKKFGNAFLAGEKNKFTHACGLSIPVPVAMPFLKEHEGDEWCLLCLIFSDMPDGWDQAQITRRFQLKMDERYILMIQDPEATCIVSKDLEIQRQYNLLNPSEDASFDLFERSSDKRKSEIFIKHNIANGWSCDSVMVQEVNKSFVYEGRVPVSFDNIVDELLDATIGTILHSYSPYTHYALAAVNCEVTKTVYVSVSFVAFKSA